MSKNSAVSWTFLLVLFLLVPSNRVACAESEKVSKGRLLSLGYSDGMVDAIGGVASLIEEGNGQNGGGRVSPAMETYLMYLVDQFYLHVHANYSSEDSGHMIYLVMRDYYIVFRYTVSDSAKDGFKKLVSLDEKQARIARLEVDDSIE